MSVFADNGKQKKPTSTINTNEESSELTASSLSGEDFVHINVSSSHKLDSSHFLSSSSHVITNSLSKLSVLSINCFRYIVILCVS